MKSGRTAIRSTMTRKSSKSMPSGTVRRRPGAAGAALPLSQEPGIRGKSGKIRGLRSHERCRPALGTAAALPPALPKDHFLELKQWTLAFPEGWGAPEKLELSTLKAWKDLPTGEEGRAFSGTVEYRTQFDWEAQEGPAILDLGRVDMIADVWVNGERADVLWAPPYRLDLAPLLRPGNNTLCVKVTGTWHNRLVYDASLSLEQRKTWTIAGPKADAPLRESGLLGPVRLYFFR